MRKGLLAISLTLVAAASSALAPSPAQAISCINVSDVTLLPSTGCNFGGLTFSDFRTSVSAGFTSGVVGLGSNSTATPSKVNLIYQLSTTPGMGPGDVLLSYAVTAGAGFKITGIDLSNDAILAPVTIGELACRVAFSASGTCAPADRLAALTADAGGAQQMSFDPVDFVFLHKDVSVGAGGFISDFSNSVDIDEITPTPEPATLLLFGSTLTGLGLAWRKRR